MSLVAGVREKAKIATPVEWRIARRLAIMSGLILGDIMSFAVVFLLFRLHGLSNIIILYIGPKLVMVSTGDLFVSLFICFIFARYIAGDYNRRMPLWDNARLTTRALLITGLVETLIVLNSGHLKILIGVLASWVTLVILLPLGRQLMRLLMSRAGLWKVPTAILASGKLGQDAYLHLRNRLELGYDFRVFIAASSGDQTPEVFDALTRFEWSPNVIDHLRASGCRQVVVALDTEPSPEMAQFINQLTLAGIFCTVVPRFVQFPLYGLTMNYIFGQQLLLLNYRNNLERLPHRLFKRAFDIAVSIILIMVFIPAILVIMVAIKWEDGGSSFFAQERVGYCGRKFRVLKFRTMMTDAEAIMRRWQSEDSELWRTYKLNYKLSNDPRVTRIGRFLRRTSLDELPQLFNILKGEMSLVGPRPRTLIEIADFGPMMGLYECVRPGITGLWQISGRSNNPQFSTRAVSDEWYIKNWSVWYDIVILICTVRIVLRSEGAY